MAIPVAKNFRNIVLVFKLKNKVLPGLSLYQKLKSQAIPFVILYSPCESLIHQLGNILQVNLSSFRINQDKYIANYKANTHLIYFNMCFLP